MDKLRILGILTVTFVLCAVILAQTPRTTYAKYTPDVKTNSRNNFDSENEMRIPTHVPGRCADNELLYPENEADWYCDCAPGFLYYPPTNTCLPAYKRGPCPERKYIMVAKIKQTKKMVVRCLDNPCKKDNFVKLNGTCLELEKTGGVCNATEVVINPNTLKPTCMDEIFLNLFDIPPKSCNPGSKRDHNGSCREIFG